jgi:nucleotide-binding universal stress UspA family protein
MGGKNIRSIKRILVATGLTQESVGAVLLARWLAESIGARLNAVHVIEPMSEAAASAVPGLAEKVESQGREELEKFALTHGLRDFAELHVAVGLPEHEILSLAAKVEADLIVMGRWGRGGMRPGLLGSNVDRVVRRFPLSVLVVEPEFRGAIEKIGLASACTDDKNLELERGMELASLFGQERISMIMAYEVPAGFHMVSDYEDAETKLAQVHEKIARGQIDKAQQRTGTAVEVDLRLEIGSPSKVLSAFAEAAGLDLLIIGAHSRSKPAELLLDHVAERVLGSATCNIWAEKNPIEEQNLRDVFKRLFD